MNWIKRHEMALFLLLAFVFSWWTWPFYLINPTTSPIIPWGPLFAALIVLALSRGWSGVKTWLADLFRVRSGLRWYLIALLLPVVVTFAAVYLNAALGGPVPGAAVYADLLMLIPTFLFITIIQGPLTEEAGWRGYLLPRLQKKYSPLLSSLIIAGIWWFWHLPLFFSDPTGQRPPLQFLIAILGYSLLFTILYNNTNRSVFLVILMHGVTNTMASFLFPSQMGAYYSRLWWLYAGLWVAAAMSAALVTRKRMLQQTTEPVPAEFPSAG